MEEVSFYLLECNKTAQMASDRVNDFDNEINRAEQQIIILNCHIKAGSDYLLQHKSELEEQFFKRFAQKINGLITSKTSMEMTVEQIKIHRVMIIETLDRFYEATTVFYPLWRQTIQSIQDTQVVSSASFTELNERRQSLINALQINTPNTAN
ncbi:hypothetical protein BKE30_14110 [Alkanindiges hydrocarboniclasticus]|uniref:Uncharacterized protein n=2 Tax=Alkanindiges hydrocarboniclasticus TaxID=1907941 RepID=A0A1S8CT48_9GAMM|nr:hypothetical protein BKE30_14110 [Alkanindiges hydrocarboniclasticus]